MKIKTKLWLIIATSLILIGCIIFTVVMFKLKWNFYKLSTIDFETNQYEIDEEYSDIKIIGNTADVVFVASNDSKSVITCFESEKEKHIVSVKDKVLTIQLNDSRNLLDHVGVSFYSPKITLNIPSGNYGNLSINLSTGDVSIEKDFSFNSIDIEGSTSDVKLSSSVYESIKIKLTTGDVFVDDLNVMSLDVTVSTGIVNLTNVTCYDNINIITSTGDVYLANVTCLNLSSTADTGSVLLKNVVASNKLYIKRDTGNVTMEKCDAVEILIITSTGDVSGTIKSEKVFIANTNTGKVDVPTTITGGRCEIQSSTGDITIQIAK